MEDGKIIQTGNYSEINTNSKKQRFESAEDESKSENDPFESLTIIFDDTKIKKKKSKLLDLVSFEIERRFTLPIQRRDNLSLFKELSSNKLIGSLRSGSIHHEPAS